MALGADGGNILRLVVRSVIAQVAAGVVVGLPLAFLATRALQGLLFEITPTDPVSFALVPLLLLAAGLASALGPPARPLPPAAALRILASEWSTSTSLSPRSSTPKGWSRCSPPDRRWSSTGSR
jgi:predicted lysophospholipase L1 biosynthesis ABC-type transport system permease subunit